MKQVFCRIPDAQPGLINGQEFERHESGALVSVGEVHPDNLELFSQVRGYAVVDSEAEARRLEQLAEANRLEKARREAEGSGTASGSESATGLAVSGAAVAESRPDMAAAASLLAGAPAAKPAAGKAGKGAAKP